MGKFSGCLLASDYDATLTNSKGVIPEEVKQAIKEYKKEGGLFTVCTGRTKQGFHDYSPEIINAPVLLANGSMAYDFQKEEIKFLCGVEKEDKEVIRKIAFEYEGAGVEMYSSTFRSFVINPDERNRKHFDIQYIPYEVVADVPDEVFPAVKVMVSVGQEKCIDFQRFLDSIDMGNLKYIPQRVGDFIEIISKNSDKGTGLMKLAECLGIEKNRVFSIGDGANDVDMLRAAYVGFVPENGCEEAKNAGNMIVKSNDEFAVADAINRIAQIIDGGTK